MRISLCLIVWNELKGCQKDIPKLPIYEFDEVFAVDGGSTDGTAEFLERAGIPVYLQPKPGLNSAYIHANKVAAGDAVVVFFPKGTLPTEDLLKFRHFFENGYDLVIASRQIRGSRNEEDKQFWKLRKWAVWCLGAMSFMIWRKEGLWIRDVLHGVKGWRKPAFTKMNILDHGLSIDLEMVVRSYKLNLPRIEFATVESSRKYGDTHFKVWPTSKKLLKYLWFELRRKENYDS